ncbi:hypothetical protein REPUB_Repub13aG0244000 [Reevesia pubescens]
MVDHLSLGLHLFDVPPGDLSPHLFADVMGVTWSRLMVNDSPLSPTVKPTSPPPIHIGKTLFPCEKYLSMEINNPNPSSRTDRKLIERNRRNQMKALYSNLNSLIPHHDSRESTSLPDQLDEAANYIKRLQINLERMKERKDSLMGVERSTNATSRSSSGPNSPQIQIHEMGSSLVIGLTTVSNSHFIFNETIRILHEEGAEIFNASFSVVDDTVFHTIHLTVGESAPDYGAARISERLTKFIHDADAYDK